jgi:hypothetical protein
VAGKRGCVSGLVVVSCGRGSESRQFERLWSSGCAAATDAEMSSASRWHALSELDDWALVRAEKGTGRGEKA